MLNLNTGNTSGRYGSVTMPSPKGSCTRKRAGQPSSIKVVRSRAASEAEHLRKMAREQARADAALRHSVWKLALIENITRAWHAAAEADGDVIDDAADALFRKNLVEASDAEFNVSRNYWLGQ